MLDQLVEQFLLTQETHSSNPDWVANSLLSQELKLCFSDTKIFW